MTFNYEEVSPKIRRPIIPIILKSETTFIIYRALIDSGADYCIFSEDLANLLEIKLSPKYKAKFRGVGKDTVEGYWKEVMIKIGEISYSTRVIFAEISDFGHGILGQHGFFDHFDVNLSYQKQSMEIKPIQLN